MVVVVVVCVCVCVRVLESVCVCERVSECMCVSTRRTINKMSRLSRRRSVYYFLLAIVHNKLLLPPPVQKPCMQNEQELVEALKKQEQALQASHAEVALPLLCRVVRAKMESG